MFEHPVNVVDPRNVSSVIRVDYAALGGNICGGAIGGDGVKMCVKPLVMEARYLIQGSLDGSPYAISTGGQG